MPVRHRGGVIRCVSRSFCARFRGDDALCVLGEWCVDQCAFILSIRPLLHRCRSLPQKAGCTELSAARRRVSAFDRGLCAVKSSGGLHKDNRKTRAAVSCRVPCAIACVRSTRHGSRRPAQRVGPCAKRLARLSRVFYATDWLTTGAGVYRSRLP